MKPTRVSAAEAREMFARGEGVVFVDARNSVAWGSSNVKLPGAVRVPIDEVDEHVRELSRDATAITFCT